MFIQDIPSVWDRTISLWPCFPEWALSASCLSNITMVLGREDVPLLVSGIWNYDTQLCLEPAVHPLHSQAALQSWSHSSQECLQCIMAAEHLPAFQR